MKGLASCADVLHFDMFTSLFRKGRQADVSKWKNAHSGCAARFFSMNMQIPDVLCYHRRGHYVRSLLCNVRRYPMCLWGLWCIACEVHFPEIDFVYISSVGVFVVWAISIPSSLPSFPFSNDFITLMTVCFLPLLCGVSWLGCDDLPAMGMASILQIAANSRSPWKFLRHQTSTLWLS